MISISLVPADDRWLAAAAPGQFVVLRVLPQPGGPALMRNYSLSDFPFTGHYRVSIKQEVNGAASTYLHTHVQTGDLLDVAAPRGNFTLKPGTNPVVLPSAGVGATPVLAMLHALARNFAARSVVVIRCAQSRRPSLCGSVRELGQKITPGQKLRLV